MPRETFDRDLRKLQDDVLILGGMAGEAIRKSVEVLKRRDFEESRKLVLADRVINEKRFAIESDALMLIATQQPMASDLRVLAAVLEIATELERIADYGKGIAKINLMIGEQPLMKPLIDVPRMADLVQEMLHEALDAFVRRDAELARSVPEKDVEIDALYNQVYRELLTFIMADPHTLDQATYLIWVAHNLERAADRVTNICERVVFMATGKMVELDGEGRENLGIEGIA